MGKKIVGFTRINAAALHCVVIRHIIFTSVGFLPPQR
jgi:hypothetical protein